MHYQDLCEKIGGGVNRVKVAGSAFSTAGLARTAELGEQAADVAGKAAGVAAKMKK